MNKTMTAPTPTDYSGLGTLWGILSAICVVLFKWINAQFAHKRLLLEQKKESEIKFIQDLVITTVTSTMEGCLKGIQGDVTRINENVTTLFKYRDEDRRHYDNRFDRMADNKK